MVIPALSALVFLLLPLFLLIQFQKVFGDKKFTLTLLAWLLVTGLLSQLQFFSNFQSMPPRLPLFIAAAFIFVIWKSFFSKKRHIFSLAPQTQLVAMQQFRIVLEIVLASLAVQNLLPVEMSYHGRNFDILIGISAVILSVAIKKYGEEKLRGLTIVWNFIGIALVTNVAVHGMLSAPYPFKVLNLSLDNAVVGYFPATWLPLFLVPTAYFLHFVSLRRAFSLNTKH